MREEGIQIALLAALCGAAVCAAAPKAGAQDIPLELIEKTNSSGTITSASLGIEVGIGGGAPRLYLFDTGSTLFNAAYPLPGGGATWTNSTVVSNVIANTHYGDGTYGYIGTLAFAPSLSFYSPTNLSAPVVAYSAPSSSAPGQIPGYQVVAVTTHCLKFNSAGAGSRHFLPLSCLSVDPSFQSDLQQNIAPIRGMFFGTFGAGDFAWPLAGNPRYSAASPLGQLSTAATRGYVVAANGPAGNPALPCSPCVIMNVTPSVLAQFSTMLPWTGVSDRTFPVSGAPAARGSTNVDFTATVNRRTYTGGTNLDTGNGSVSIFAPGRPVAAGTPVTIAGAAPGSAAFTYAAAAAGPYQTSVGRGNAINPGIGFFLKNSVLFDLYGNETGYTSNFVTDVSIATSPGAPFTVTASDGPLGLAGVISGGGDLVIGAGGSATLSNVNAYTGRTIVASGGTLDLVGPVSIVSSSGVSVAGVFDVGPPTTNGGNVVASNIEVQQGGRLTGSAAIGPTTIDSGGTLAPRASVAGSATLSVVGSLIFHPGALYSLGLTPNAADRTDVAGPAELGGATVEISRTAGLYNLYAPYVILTATGGISGAFDPKVADVTATDAGGSPTSFAFVSPVLSYGEDDVVLSYVPIDALWPGGPPDYRTAAANRNELSVATGLTIAAISDPNPILAALNFSTLPEARAAFDQLSGAGIAGAESAAFLSGSLFTSTMTDQGLFWLQGDPDPVGVTLGGPAAAGAQSRTGGAAAPESRTWRAWFTGFGADETLGASASLGAPQQSSSSFGGVLGLDRQILPNLLVGLAGGFSDAVFSANALSTSGAVAGGHLGAYGVATVGPFYGEGSLAYAAYVDRTTRDIPGFGGLTAATASGSWRQQELRGRLELGRRFALGEAQLAPFAAIEAANLWSGGFAESDGGADLYSLALRGQSQMSVPASLGLRASDALDLPGGGRLSAALSLAWVHEIEPQREVNATLLSTPDASWTVFAAPAARNAAEVRVGAQLAFSAATAIFVNFDGDFAGPSVSIAGKAGLRISF